MTAIQLIKRRKGVNMQTGPVPKTKLPPLLRQDGTGCDCKGCDKG